jgi:hypothetical protein
MTFAGLNYLAIGIAAVAAWLVGAVWYMGLGKIWTAAQGLTPEKMHERRAKPGAFLIASWPSRSWPGSWPASGRTSAADR